jgi:electron transfer flavoprotein beta subunit
VSSLKIVACFKAVPDEKDLVVNSDNTISFDRAEWKVGQYDLNAVEAGVQLAEELGNSEIVVLTVGGTRINNSKLKKAILSRGANQMYGVCEETLESIDSYATAQILAAAIRKIGDVDLVLCGEGSGDLYSQQVGAILGHYL